MVLGLAGTAMPFAGSRQAEAERWLRVLRLHGQVGQALQALGVGEAPLETMADPVGQRARHERRQEDEDVVALVARRAGEFATERRANAVGTIDVLFALLHVYGRDFDRALYVRGTDPDELLGRLGGGVLAQFAE